METFARRILSVLHREPEWIRPSTIQLLFSRSEVDHGNSKNPDPPAELYERPGGGGCRRQQCGGSHGWSGGEISHPETASLQWRWKTASVRESVRGRE